MARIEFGPEARVMGIGPEATLFAYFIQSESTGAIKIGSSRQPKRRLFALQCAHDAELILLAVTDEFTELELHKKFAPIRLRGEWFRPEVELLEFISNLGCAEKQNAIATRDTVKKLSEDMITMATRSEILSVIANEVKMRRMPDREAARTLGLTQALFIDLMKGRIERFSIDALATVADRIGFDIKFSITRRER